MATIHGPHAAEEIGAYDAAESMCTALAWSEVWVWDRLIKIVPTTPEAVVAWLNYVLARAAEKDEVVNLRQAFAHTATMLAERLR